MSSKLFVLGCCFILLWADVIFGVLGEEEIEFVDSLARNLDPLLNNETNSESNESEPGITTNTKLSIPILPDTEKTVGKASIFSSPSTIPGITTVEQSETNFLSTTPETDIIEESQITNQTTSDASTFSSPSTISEATTTEGSGITTATTTPETVSIEASTTTNAPIKSDETTSEASTISSPPKTTESTSIEGSDTTTTITSPETVSTEKGTTTNPRTLPDETSSESSTTTTSPTSPEIVIRETSNPPTITEKTSGEESTFSSPSTIQEATKTENTDPTTAPTTPETVSFKAHTTPEKSTSDATTPNSTISTILPVNTTATAATAGYLKGLPYHMEYIIPAGLILFAFGVGVGYYVSRRRARRRYSSSKMTNYGPYFHKVSGCRNDVEEDIEMENI